MLGLDEVSESYIPLSLRECAGATTSRAYVVPYRTIEVDSVRIIGRESRKIFDTVPSSLCSCLSTCSTRCLDALRSGHMQTEYYL